MALEAMRQIRATSKSTSSTSNIRLSCLEFPSHVSLFATGSNDLELCLSLTKTTGSNAFGLQISFLQDNSSEPAWRTCCSGTANFIPDKALQPNEDDSLFVGDTVALKYVQSLGIYELDKFSDLRLDRTRAEGSVTELGETPESSAQCLALATILSVPEILTTTWGLLARHCIHRITSVEVDYSRNRTWTMPNSFCAEQTQRSTTRSSSNITCRFTKAAYIQIEGIRTEAQAFISLKPPMQSLFLTPVVLPDISYLENHDPMEITKVLGLLSHKWPMCDIGIGDILAADFEMIYDIVTPLEAHVRAEYRSLAALHSLHSTRPGLRQSVDLESEKFHMLFGTIPWIRSNHSCLNMTGLVCARLLAKSDWPLFREIFHPICAVTGLSDGEFVLGRYKKASKFADSTQDSPTGVISSVRIDRTSTIENSGFSTFLMKDIEMWDHRDGEPCIASHNSRLIVLDVAERSLLLNTTNSKFLSWFQPLLRGCKSLVWTTTRTSSSPFDDVASGFIKTLISEYPLLCAVNVIVEDTINTEGLLSFALQAQSRLLEGSKETETTIRNSKAYITRYKPDDNLAASIGILPPRHIHNYPACGVYEIIRDCAKGISLRTNKQQNIFGSDNRTVRVDVGASVIDHFDVGTVHDFADPPEKQQGLGRFFSGVIRNWEPGSSVAAEHVVGWCNGSHRSNVDIEASRLYSVQSGLDMFQAAAQFAAYALAVAFIKCVVRPLSKESVSIQVSGILGAMLRKVCLAQSVILNKDNSNHSDFLLSFDPRLGFLVNKKPVKLLKYLDYDEIHRNLPHDFSLDREQEYPLQVFKLSEAKQAFEFAKDHPGDTVISWDTRDEIADCWLTAAPTSLLFNPDAAYIIIGGLGGLGRHLMAWMIRHGAKYIFSLSRRGRSSPWAAEMFKMVDELGGNLEVCEIDACDEAAMQTLFARIRSSRTIRGCFNMCLQLANSHLSTMTSEQWESAITTKVQSSWNLHQASLKDNLDMFILFSSVSSISGNRTQANYAVGNAFLNRLADYRRSSLGLPALSIALGAMSGLGVLADDPQLLQTLSRSGLCCYDSTDFDKILEAALLESYTSERSLICTGLQRFKSLDGDVQSQQHQTQVFWLDWPEFGFMFDYERTDATCTKPKSLLESIEEGSDSEKYLIIHSAFQESLQLILGREIVGFKPEISIALCGLDSLNTIACRYWFFKGRLYFALFECPLMQL